MNIKQATKALVILVPLVAFLLYFWGASFLLLSEPVGAQSIWNINATVNVTNAAPNVTLVIVDDNITSPPSQIDLLPGSTVLVTCNGTINDTNGYQDVASARAYLYDNVSSTSASADNNESHYSNASCVLGAGSGTNVDASCSFRVLYYANNQTWACNFTAIDLDSANSSLRNYTVVNLLVAMNLSNLTLDYGNLAPGATSASSVLENITNHGNTQIDLALNGSDMPCTGTNSVGTINVTLQHYNVTGTLETYANMRSLNYTQTTEGTFNLAKKTDATGDQIRTTYWKIQVPYVTKGRCTGNVTLTAVQG